jgi:hypothetical protein
MATTATTTTTRIRVLLPSSFLRRRPPPLLARFMRHIPSTMNATGMDGNLHLLDVVTMMMMMMTRGCIFCRQVIVGHVASNPWVPIAVIIASQRRKVQYRVKRVWLETRGNALWNHDYYRNRNHHPNVDC